MDRRSTVFQCAHGKRGAAIYSGILVDDVINRVHSKVAACMSLVAESRRRGRKIQ